MALLSIRERAELPASPEEVFAFVTDFSNLPHWDPSVVEVIREDSGDVRAGSAWEVRTRFRGNVLPMRYEITEFQPAHRAVLVGDGAQAHAVDTIEVSPSETGASLSYEADFELKGWRRFFAPLVRGAIRQLGQNARHGLETHFASLSQGE